MKRLFVLSVVLLAVGCSSKEPTEPSRPSAGPGGTPQAQEDAAAKGMVQAVAVDIEDEDRDEPFFGGMEGELVEPFESMSLEEFEAAWKIDFDVADRPAGEVLEELFNQLGLSFERTGSEDALAKPVSVRLPGCSRLQAIEEVCRLVGLYPSYQEPEASQVFFGFDPDSEDEPPAVTVTLKAGPRPWPVVFAGPLLIEVSGVETFPPYATGTLKLTIRAFALPSSLKDFLQEEGDAELALEQVSGSDGQDLWDDDRMSTHWSMPLVPLKNLLRGLESIEAVRGKLQIPVPARVENLEITKVEPGSSREAEGVQVTLEQVEKEESCGLRFAIRDLDADEITWQPLDAQRNELEVGGTGSFFFGSRGQVELTVEGRPASLVASVAGGDSVRFDKLEAGLGAEVGGGRIALARVENRESCSLSVKSKGVDYDSIRIIPRDAQRNPMKTQRMSSGGSDDEAQFDLGVEGAPASVTANFISAMEKVTYEFELKSIPLGSLEGMPEKLEPLDFAGHEAPVTVEFVKFVRDEHFPDGRNLRLRATNHSNKDVREIDMLLVYRDGDGKKLDDFPGSHFGALHGITGNQETIVAKKDTAEFDESAAFMPEETKSASITVRSVEFADGTAWEPNSGAGRSADNDQDQ